MRRLVITQNITLDGSIEMLGDWFDPQGQADMSDVLEEIGRQQRQSGALLVGRRTFEDMRGYWRDLQDDETGVSDHLNAVDKHVVSSTMTDPDWDRTEVVCGDVVEQVRSLKERDGKDIVLTGSIRLGHAMIAADLVDGYRLFVYPVVQGGGRRLFPEGFELGGLELLETKAFVSGIALLRYGSR
ncbi:MULTISPECIES: dihydrofolate reductase family protein [unclassified Knoellia]|uniref:dihydrofolate reductase family protein n=1 Tax=Knoellia altitudinis TaxID=3404795 RepID=UPI00360C427D